ncbi:MAG: efflux RND transporter periplasmic adaptor subunit [Treponema sp.]|nr:efflux RND transporter periplasmic adaptor subunit [Treponema sp.]
MSACCLNKIAVLLAFVFLITACKTKKIQEQSTVDAVNVSVVEVVRELLIENMQSFGTITYKTKNDVTCLEDGKIIYFPVKEGDFVREGQVIAQLKNVQLEFQKEQYENALASAQASLAVAKNALREDELAVESRLLSIDKSALTISQKELELENEQETLRNKTDLHSIGGITDAMLKQLQLQEKALQTEIALLKKEQEIALLGLRDRDLRDAGYVIPSDIEEKRKLLVALNTKSTVTKIEAAEADVRNAQTSLAAINKLIDELTVRSPITGIVGAKSYEIGEYIGQNAKIATIMDTSSVFAVVYVQEKDAVNYAQGSDIEILLPSLNKTIHTVISEISPVADPHSGNFSVKAIIENKDGAIKPGMFVKCTIIQKNQTAYCKVPDSVLVAKDGAMGTVFCVQKNFAVLKKIRIALQKDGFLWISEGMLPGDIAIINPSPFLKEGQHVYW